MAFQLGGHALMLLLSPAASSDKGHGQQFGEKKGPPRLDRHGALFLFTGSSLWTVIE